MGADLYIMSIFKANHAQYEPEFAELVEQRNQFNKAGKYLQAEQAQEQIEQVHDRMYEAGYFRDSYNDSNLLWLFGISYWQDIRDMLNQQSELEPEQAKTLLKRLNRRERIFEARLQEQSVLESWTKEERETYFRKKYAEFRRFLQQAIDLNKPIYCSI